MNIDEAIKEAEHQISQCTYLKECSPGVYETGLNTVYERKSEMLQCLTSEIRRLRYANDFEQSQCVKMLERIAELEAENERLKGEKPVLCGECIYSSWAGRKTADDCPMNLFRLGANFGNTDVKQDDYCSYGERRGEE
ncbi:hypothetical protein [Anaerotignum propionicum]|uniref:hypothetical protein n=1 Tax=Anaerotignum propionicum TaxID=28446 RepID=UPI0028996153|nr:hypothetical protein [Anaerotignum propionicum]